MVIERGGPEVFKNLPVYPDRAQDVAHPAFTPAIIHRPSRRLYVEASIERLAAPIWRMLGMYGF